jgi:hypothetical protein
MDNEKLQQKILELENKVKTLESNYAKHQHDSLDGTNTLRKNIKLDNDQWLQVGLGGQGTLNNGVSGRPLDYGISVGKDDGRTGQVYKADLLQMNMVHGGSQSFYVGRRTPVVVNFPGTPVATTAGGNTITISGFNFATNELADAYINISNSSKVLVETRKIVSNTATVITIDGTWAASTSNAIFGIYKPVYLGSAENNWQRIYTTEGTDGGLRFGIGATNENNQNGLLYMDSAGDLYWRNKAGTAVKLN